MVWEGLKRARRQKTYRGDESVTVKKAKSLFLSVAVEDLRNRPRDFVCREE